MRRPAVGRCGAGHSAAQSVCAAPPSSSPEMVSAGLAEPRRQTGRQALICACCSALSVAKGAAKRSSMNSASAAFFSEAQSFASACGATNWMRFLDNQDETLRRTSAGGRA